MEITRKVLGKFLEEFDFVRSENDIYSDTYIIPPKELDTRLVSLFSRLIGKKIIPDNNHTPCILKIKIFNGSMNILNNGNSKYLFFYDIPKKPEFKGLKLFLEHGNEKVK